MSLVTDNLAIVNKDLRIEDLKPHPKNYRKHPLVQLMRLKESLEKYGQPRSIVCQDDADGSYTIVAGHGVVEAAKQLKWTTVRADIVPNSWDAAKVRGYLVSDNNLNRGAIDDNEILASLLREQVNLGNSVTSVGFTQEEANELFLKVNNAHAADFLKEVLQPTQPIPMTPTTQKPFEPFPGEGNEIAYEDDENEETFSPASLGQTHSGFSTPPTSFPVASRSDIAPVQEDIQWFPVTYTVTKDQRQILLDAIKKAKSQWGLETSAESLVQICAMFLVQ